MTDSRYDLQELPNEEIRIRAMMVATLLASPNLRIRCVADGKEYIADMERSSWAGGCGYLLSAMADTPVRAVTKLIDEIIRGVYSCHDGGHHRAR